MLDYPLLDLDTSTGVTDIYTLRDAVQGILIFGGMGSGKTSGSGQTLALRFLQEGFGGLVLCVKEDEARLWQDYAAATGRSDDLILFSADGPHRFNFLNYELTRAGRGGGQTDNAVRLFEKVVQYARPGGQAGSKDPYWDNAMRQMMRNAIDILVPAGITVTLDNISKLINSAPASKKETSEEDWYRTAYLADAMQRANTRLRAGEAPGRQRDFNLAVRYWLDEFSTLAAKTRSSVVSVFSSMADSLNRGMLYELLGTETTFTPEDSQQRKIIVLDLNAHEFGPSGLVAQNIVKLLWQQAVMRRNTAESPWPVFLWADEAQYFVNEDDAKFQQVARSQRAITVFLTQNLNNIYSQFGGGEDGKSTANSILGNFGTRIFHANGDHLTNFYAADTIGEEITMLRSRGISIGSSGYGESDTRSETLQHKVLPATFQTLKTGGPPNDYVVEAILFKTSKLWRSTGQPWTRVSFSQRSEVSS